MNEKFFDLKKEKQDRIMGSAMQSFAESGYTHASTDDIVKRAHISKGLLFHYFGSKLNLYKFLYDYSVRFIKMEINRSIGENETDYFILQEQRLLAWENAMRQYPYICMFLLRADEETDEEALAETAEVRESYRSIQADLRERYDNSVFRDDSPAELTDRIIWYALIGFLKDTDKSSEGWLDKFLADSRACINMIKLRCTLTPEERAARAAEKEEAKEEAENE